MPECTFLRYERKFYIKQSKFKPLMNLISKHTAADEHCQNGGYFVTDRYYDTENYFLAIEALLKPAYREKLRIRRYGRGETAADECVFLEQKMKINGFGHKRRIPLSFAEAERFISDGSLGGMGQSAREIEYLLSRHTLLPSADICYYRMALTAPDDPGVRITFDTDLWAFDERGGGCVELLSGDYLMEIKIPHSFPLWLTSALHETGARPISFSKYGRFYNSLCGISQDLNSERGKTYA